MYINGPGKQSEGDTKTPLGTWTIGEAYGINDDPGSRVPYTKVDDDMYWCATGSISNKFEVENLIFYFILNIRKTYKYFYQGNISIITNITFL